MKKIFYFFIVFLYLLCNTTWAQEPTQKYQFVNIKESVSKIGVYTIIQDHYGFIWLGTNGTGLNKFDGIDYTSYKHKLKDSTSLSSNNISCSYLDKNNRLWFGTNEGLSLYDRKNDRFKNISLSEFKKSKTNISIRSLKGDHKGNLFIGTFKFGLFKLNLVNFKVEKIASKEPGSSSSITIHALQLDKTGKLYAGTDKGLKEYDEKTNSLKPSLFRNKEAIKDPIQMLLIDSKNNLWVGTVTNGLIKINGEIDNLFSVDRISITENRILTIIELPDETIMCGTENDGLYHIDANGKIINHYVSNKKDKKSILSNSIWSLFLDKNERIWMGYYNAGIGVYDSLYDKFKDIKSLHNNDTNSLKTNSVTAIIEDQSGKFWIGMDGGGIDILDSKANHFTHINSLEKGTYSGLTNDYVESLFIDSKQNLWAGTWNKGLFFLKKGSTKFVNYTIKNTKGELSSNNIISITEDPEGTLWYASWDKGLHSYNPNTKKFTHHKSEPFLKHGLSDCYARKVLIDQKGDLWLSTTSKGLFKIKKLKDNTFSVISMAKRMSKQFNTTTANHILSLHEGADGSIWIGTSGAGLCKYDRDLDQFIWYNKSNGLEADNITGIIEDFEGIIWLTTNSGISKFDTKTTTFTRFTKNDGLLSNDFNLNATYRDDEGILYFGNYQGVDYFNPSSISTNTILPSLYLTGFKLFNKDVFPNNDESPLKSVIGETNSITLNHKQSVFTIEYVGINYTRPEINKYAYYLKGLEESWNYVGDLRSATYTNLEHGDYTFMLKSANSDGLWNEQPLELKITVLPPWWKTNEALFGYVILLLFAFYLLNRMTKLRVNRKQIIALERIKILQEKALNEEKFQFFTNISHEFRTPLTLIMNPINDIIRNDSLNLPIKIKEKHHIIYKNTDRLYRLINELLDFRKLELNKTRVSARKLNLVDFTKNVVSYFKQEVLTNNIDLNLDANLMNIPVWSDENMLEKIIFNILSNAIKVTPKGGTINIDLQSTDNLYILPLVNKNKPIKVVEIIISDTGAGIEKEEVERIFERFYQVKNLNKGYYGGTGIGLEVVRDFINLHKGKIEVESTVGKGTKFKIMLPAGKSHFEKSEIATEKVEQQFKNEKFIPKNTTIEKEKINIKNKNGYKHTLLIVEDNTELRDYLKNEIGNEYKVLTATNGKKGLEIAKELLPDIIITDVIMPEMDGFDFCKKIKTNISTSHIPLLMLTAKAKIDDRMEGLELGADAYMVKPFDMRLLRLRLSQLIISRHLIFNKYFSLINGVSKNVNTTYIDKGFIEKVLTHINENISDPNLNVESLAYQLNLSRSQFYRKIKALTNQTANEFLKKIRLQRAKQIIENGNTNISEVSYKIGFASPSYFTKCFKNYFGMLPKEVKQKTNV